MSSVTADPARRPLIKAVHARARELGLDIGTRRVLQTRVTGHASCRDMSAAALRAVLAAMDRNPAAKTEPRTAARGDRLPEGPHRGKLWALWLSGWHLGVVETPSEAALARFIERQTGLDAARWAQDERDTGKAIEGLKAWLSREAGVDWSPYAGVDAAGTREQIDNPRARVLEAQWRILHALGVVKIDDPGALASYAARHAGIARAISHTHLEADEAKALIAHLGERIRDARTGR